MTLEDPEIKNPRVEKEPTHQPWRLTEYMDNPDFSDSDFWARFFVSNIVEQAHVNNFFEDQQVTEVGIGNGRIIVALARIGVRLKQVTGLEVDPKIIPLARFNLDQELKPRNIPYAIEEVDAVFYFHNYAEEVKKGKKGPISGRGIMCLPQSFHPDNDLADGYIMTPLLKPYAEKYGKYALALNAAVLDYLSEVTDPDFQMAMILSGRVPWKEREKIITDAGWEITSRVKSEPIQQDFNTNFDYVQVYDDGQRFFEKFVNDEGEEKFRSITAQEAVGRKKKIEIRITNGETVDLRKEFNVHHELIFYIIRKHENVIMTEDAEQSEVFPGVYS